MESPLPSPPSSSSSTKLVVTAENALSRLRVVEEDDKEKITQHSPPPMTPLSPIKIKTDEEETARTKKPTTLLEKMRPTSLKTKINENLQPSLRMRVTASTDELLNLEIREKNYRECRHEASAIYESFLYVGGDELVKKEKHARKLKEELNVRRILCCYENDSNNNNNGGLLNDECLSPGSCASGTSASTPTPRTTEGGSSSDDKFDSSTYFERMSLPLMDTSDEDIACVLYDAFDFMLGNERRECVWEKNINRREKEEEDYEEEKDDDDEEGGCLVHCQMGCSRSVAICVAFVMWREGLAYDEAFERVKKARSIARPNIGFVKTLEAWHEARTNRSTSSSSSSMLSDVVSYRIVEHKNRKGYIVPKRENNNTTNNNSSYNNNNNNNNNNSTSGKRRSMKSGVYLYGSPGRGKTVLVDSFKDAFTNEEKKKIKSLSFRSLMDEMHENLMKIRNVRNPVREIGSRYKKAHEVLIVDEVEVTDVADARIWKAFVESYLTEDDLESEKKNTKKREKNAKKRNILVCTSNFKPKQLYKGGLNWKSLLVSEVLSERLDAVSLDGEEHESPEKFRDYRKASFAAEEASARKIEGGTSSLSSSSSSMIFGDDADASLRLHWEKLLSSKNRSKRHHHALSDRLEKDIQSAATSIEANAKAAYFDFAALCGANAKWSPRDYENLSKAYEFVFLESIPVLDVAILGEDVVRRFVMVIDALYANKTKLYCSSPSTKSIADLFPQSSSTPSRENSSSSTATATTTFVSKTGGASGRNATMLSENIEWSATGLTKASLAALSSGSFTDKSKPRCQSRLYEMKTEAYKRDRPA